MAHLIPCDVARARDIRQADIVVAEALGGTLPDEDRVYYNAPGASNRPRFLWLSSRHGIVGMDVLDWSPVDGITVRPSSISLAGRKPCDPLGDLGTQLEGVRREVAGFKPTPDLHGVFFFPHFTAAELESAGFFEYFSPGSVVGRDAMQTPAWTRALAPSERPLQGDDLLALLQKLYPESSFPKTRLLTDANGARRQEVRIQLDAYQESLARSLSSGITLLSGVAGSGKSLVLCARARALAKEHPDWKIAILCFNRTLVSCLSDLVGDVQADVTVQTFFSWANGLGLRLPFIGPEGGEEKTDQVVSRAIRNGLAKHSYDAILIDEGQDFPLSWFQFAFHVLRPDRGGMVVVADPDQSIYRQENLESAFPGQDVARIRFAHNYRSTVQVQEFAARSVFNAARPSFPACEGWHEASTGQALDGAKVELVWASSWDYQAEYIATWVNRLVTQRQAAYRDIAVLYPQRSGTLKRLEAEFDALEIPYYSVTRDPESKANLDLAENSVKIISVHSAKGFEFPVVFIMAVEALKVPANVDETLPEYATRVRVAYVAMTRAQDRLFLSYTRKNAILDRALTLQKWCEFRQYPDSFDLE